MKLEAERSAGAPDTAVVADGAGALVPFSTLRQDEPRDDAEASSPSGATTPSRSGAASHHSLRPLLVALDVAGVTLAWSIAIQSPVTLASPATKLSPVPIVAALVGVTLALHASKGLYRARVCSVRALEARQLGWIAFLVSTLALIGGGAAGIRLAPGEVAVGFALSLALLWPLREAYRSFLRACRNRGRLQRRVVIVGANDEAHDVYRLVVDHPELGFSIAGVVGERSEVARLGFAVPYLGEVPAVEEALSRADASGAIVTATALSFAEVNYVTRALLDAGIHVHLSNGLRGIAQTRLRPNPLAYEPFFYVESANDRRASRFLKRTLDVMVATLVLLVSLPVLAVAAVGIRLTDGGPVLFRQPRVGRGGQLFNVLKLRTMVPDADRCFDRLAREFGARTGPLRKLKGDPRVTPVGRVLRATSIDELPQLINVLRGSMSLVGPRPVVPQEADAFDALYRAKRNAVRPGITGLWQVEARDHPSFEVYRRLDLFYLENRSTGIDLAILLLTVQRVIGRFLGMLLWRRKVLNGREPAGAFGL